MTAIQQRSILLAACLKQGQLTKQEAVELVGKRYYHNAEKYVGEILSRLVNSGHLIRVKPGLFVPGSTRNPVAKPQPELFT